MDTAKGECHIRGRLTKNDIYLDLDVKNDLVFLTPGSLVPPPRSDTTDTSDNHETVQFLSTFILDTSPPDPSSFCMECTTDDGYVHHLKDATRQYLWHQHLNQHHKRF